MANDILVEGDDGQETYSSMDARDSLLASWVMDRVQKWRQYRDQKYLGKWEEYYRLWKGEWNPADKNRDSERSRLISPALQQAVEMIVAEQTEATFGRGMYWFDIDDDAVDQKKDDAYRVRQLLAEDFEMYGVNQAIADTYLNGALYGTGISKIYVTEQEEKTPVSVPYAGNEDVRSADVERKVKFVVKVEPIDPKEFVIDPTARDIDEALGCATEMVKPRHLILQRQESGLYNDYEIGAFSTGSSGLQQYSDLNTTGLDDKVFVTEYYGLVPAKLLDEPADDEASESVTLDEDDEKELVEAIVTIANGGVLLRKRRNPYLMGDRPIVAYPHDRVPNQFHGRGVCEKGYNSQKALDSELRARIDALALLTHPMVAMDATRLPRGLDMKVRPGKAWLGNGDPSTIFMPLKFGALEQATFPQSADLERMVQMATGAMDTAAPLSNNPRNETASGMSMMMGAMIKRNKRTMYNIENLYLDKLIQKCLWRYMQFDPERYPPGDYKFVIHSSMGIMAREVEQNQLTRLLQMTEPGTPTHAVILRAIYNNSSMADKDKMLKALEETLKPNPMQQQAAQVQMAQGMAEVEKTKAEAAKAMAQAKQAASSAGPDPRIEMAMRRYEIDKEHEREMMKIMLEAKSDKQRLLMEAQLEKLRMRMENEVKEMQTLLDHKADMAKVEVQRTAAAAAAKNKPSPK